MDTQIERRITEQAARDRCKTGEGKKPTGLFKRIADDQRKSGESQRIRHTVDPRY